MRIALATLVTTAALLACSSSSSSSPGATTTDAGTPAKTDAEQQAEVTTKMHDTIATELAALLAAAKDLQAAAPTPTGRGWDATQDAAQIQAMKDAWRRARVAYEHVEGVIAPIFPDIDAAIDARYDDFLTTLGGKGDADPFDKTGVTGMHAIERILYAPGIRTSVIDFEKALPGYAPAAFPATEAEATRFKTELAQQLVDDLASLESQWKPARIDIGVAFNGLVSLMAEQHEKVNKAATGEEESRYADMTLFDLRNNLDGTETVYAFFRPWITSHDGGAAADTSITSGFAQLHQLYGGYQGDTIPAPPATWSSLHPTDADLATPFGRLYDGVSKAAAPEVQGSVVYEMNVAAKLLGLAAK